MPDDKLVIEHINPSILAQWFLSRTLKEITALQIALAKEGVLLELHTAEVHLIEPAEAFDTRP